MTALTLKMPVSQVLMPVSLAGLSADGAGLASVDQSGKRIPVALQLLACRCLLQENLCLEAEAGLEALLRGLTRDALLEAADWARRALGLQILPLVLLAEASVRHSGDPREAKGDVRRAAIRLVRNGAQATRLLACWLERQGGGNKARLPNALKKGLAEALSAMSEVELLAGPRAVPLKDLLCLIHARPGDAEQASLFGRIMAAEAAQTTAEALPELALREQSEPEALSAEVAQAQLTPLKWLMLERAAETPELKQALRLALADTLVGLPRWQGRSALLVDTGAALLNRLAGQPALQVLDIATMLAALAALRNDCLLGAFATEVKWLESAAFPVETALQLRQAETGWGQTTWRAVASLLERVELPQRVLIFTAGEPDTALLATWQRYLQRQPQAVLWWIDLTAETTGLELSGDGSRMVRLKGWSDQLLELVEPVEALM